MSMDIHIAQIRNASEIDVLRGLEAQFANLHFRYDEDAIASLKKNFHLRDSYYLTVRSGNEFAGFCSLDSDWWEPQFFFLREIFIPMAHQGKGIGEALMRSCLDYAHSKKVQGVVTETAFENIPMQRLCEKCGFQRWENPQWKEGLTYKLLFAS